MPLYLVVGQTYGVTLTYWPTEAQALEYQHLLEKYSSDSWHIVRILPPLPIQTIKIPS